MLAKKRVYFRKKAAYMRVNTVTFKQRFVMNDASIYLYFLFN